jgi:hypothetical protein
MDVRKDQRDKEDRADKEFHAKQEASDLAFTQRSLAEMETIEVKEFVSLTEYESGMVILKYKDDAGKSCDVSLYRVVPEKIGKSALGPKRAVKPVVEK